MRDNTGIIVAITDDGCTVAKLLNSTDQQLELHPGSHLGVFYHVNECDRLNPAEVFSSQQLAASLLNILNCQLSAKQRLQLQDLLKKHQRVFHSRWRGAVNPALIKHHTTHFGAVAYACHSLTAAE